MASGKGVAIWGGSRYNSSNNCSNNKSIRQLETNQPIIIVLMTFFYNNPGCIKLVLYIFLLSIFLLYLFVVCFRVNCLSTYYILQALIDASDLLFLYTILVACFVVLILFNYLCYALLILLPLNWITASCITSSRLAGNKLANSRVASR